MNSEVVEPRLPAPLRGPIRIVAGAGTGKTEAVAAHFRGLVAAGVDPAGILVMTFTERAATAMAARIDAALGGYLGELWIGTFHSVAQRLLHEEGWRQGAGAGSRILAGADRWIAMRELLWTSGEEALVGAERPDDLVNPLLRLQERLKQELVPAGRLAAWAATVPDPELRADLLAAARLFQSYDRWCREQRLLDFDELIVRLVRLLESRPDVRERFVKRFTAVLVDEYQDTNLAQERMVELLAGRGNVAVVGDDDQSIYRFRGASRASLDRFARIFPGARTRALGRNRRSSGHIVAAAAELVANNADRLPKRLTSARPAGVRVEVWTARDGVDEALAITEEVRRLALGGMPLSRMALLVRTNALSRPAILALRAAGIPYQLWGARGFYRRPEILDVMAYFRVLVDPTDEVAIARLAARPGTGLPLDESLDRLGEARKRAEPPLSAFAGWPPAAGWLAVVTELRGLSARLGVDELFFELMNLTGYLEVESFDSERDRRQAAANLAKFADLLDRYCERRSDHSLPRFMEYLELVLLSESDEEVAQADEVEDAVQVMTIHQAKGLEFEAVFVPSLVEGRLPQPQRGDRLAVPPALAGGGDASEGADASAPAPGDHLAEERRLLYVAMTRARDRLYLSRALTYEGSRRWRPSRFLSEVLAAGPGHFQEVELPVLGGWTAGSTEPIGNRLGPAPAQTGPLSYTSIATFRECPLQFRYRYVHRLPARQTPEGVHGVAVHEALRRLGQRRQEVEVLEDTDVESAVQAGWATLRFPDERRRAALMALSRVQVRRYVEAGGFAARPVHLELPFTADLEGWRLRGVIDRLDEPAQPGGPWRLIDYKTGARLPASKLRRDLQLALYALGARRALGIDSIELEIVYLKDAARVAIPAEPELLAEAAATGASIAAEIAGGEFPARPERRRCSLCPYRLACPEAL